MSRTAKPGQRQAYVVRIEMRAERQPGQACNRFGSNACR